MIDPENQLFYEENGLTVAITGFLFKNNKFNPALNFTPKWNIVITEKIIDYVMMMVDIEIMLQQGENTFSIEYKSLISHKNRHEFFPKTEMNTVVSISEKFGNAKLFSAFQNTPAGPKILELHPTEFDLLGSCARLYLLN